MSTDPLSEIAAAAGAPQDAPDLRPSTGAVADGSEHDVIDLGPDCPIQALGFLKQKFYFLDVAGQLIELGSEFRKGELIALFGPRITWLDAKWPMLKQVGKKTLDDGTEVILYEPDPSKGFNQAQAQRGLILACHKRGLFDPTGKVRGRGAHRGDEGELVLHCGDAVLVGGRRGVRNRLLKSASFKPGLVGAYVYPTAPGLAHPAETLSSTAIGEQVLHTFASWNWKEKAVAVTVLGRPVSIAAYLLFCLQGAMRIGGALKWRPHGWITGPSGAGKTTLQDYIEQLLGDWAIRTEDATAAGVRQLLNQDTRSVMFDEIEPDEANGDVHTQIVKLARLSSSGGSSLRGSQDHQHKAFVAKACFLFSSIHHHELAAQDRNRIVILQLSQFPAKTEPLILPPLLKEWGGQMTRRMLEQWPRFAATLSLYQKEMLRQGYSGREQDQYGTLLACGDLLLHDEAPPEAVTAHLNGEPDRCADLVKRLAHLLDSARAEGESTTQRAIGHLTSYRLAAASGQHQEPVSVWLKKAFIDIVNKTEKTTARDKIESHGLRLVHLAPDHDKGNGQGGLIAAYLAEQSMYVAIANATHAGMVEIFDKSTFPKGGWRQPLAEIPGALTNKKSRFAGGGKNSHGCVLVPLEELIDVEAARIEAAQGDLGV